MNPSKNLLLIFTRNPVLGKCKTRLAKTIGDRSALEVYRHLIEHTVKITAKLKMTKHVYYSESIGQDDVWDDTIFSKKLQKGNDLGERMADAFHSGFESDFDKIIIIGSDMYDLKTSDLQNAFRRLDQYDYVLRPAKDGGYYLLGMKKFRNDIFQNKKWGTETVLEDTLADLKNENFILLETKNDIDAFQPYLKYLNI